VGIGANGGRIRAVISGLVLGYRVLVRSCIRLYAFGSRLLKSPETPKIAVEFLKEAAVLVGVFPILDTIVPIGGDPNVGWQRVTWPLVITSEGVALLLLVLAVIISERGRR
jgi:hypothetical protein